MHLYRHTHTLCARLLHKAFGEGFASGDSQSSGKLEERETLMQASHQKQNTCPHEFTHGLYRTSKHIGHFQSSDISAGSSISERQRSNMNRGDQGNCTSRSGSGALLSSDVKNNCMTLQVARSWLAHFECVPCSTCTRIKQVNTTSYCCMHYYYYDTHDIHTYARVACKHTLDNNLKSNADCSMVLT